MTQMATSNTAAASEARRRITAAKKLPKKTAPVAKYTLHQFFAVWANLQLPKWDIPAFHIEVLDFLADHKNWDNRTGLIQIFRGAAKSTIVGLFIVWMLTQDPTLRFLIVSSNDEMAKRMSSDVQGIISRHPLAAHLNTGGTTWRDGHLFVAGHTDNRSPSVKAKSIESSMTGSRADWIIYDDVEDSENVQTEYQREKLRRQLREPTHILVPGGTELFVGTPHTWDSIYPEMLGEAGKEQPFRTGASSVKIPIITDVQGEFPELTGTPTWPERFSNDEVLKKQSGSGTKGNFLSQYMLVPYNPKDTILDPTLIAPYTHEVVVHEANGGLIAMIGDHRVVGVSAYWDPSMGTTTSDASVLSIVFTTDDGNYFIHRTERLTGTPQIQAEKAILIMKACSVTHVVIETNGAGASFPSIFRERAAGKGVTCEGRPTNTKKELRIVQAFEMRLFGGFIHAHRTVLDSPFWGQLRDFNPSKRSQKDDFIDSVAMAILAQPFRLKAGSYGSRASQWQSAGGGGFEVAVDPVSF
ncbi:phage terminase large subunit [Hydrogenophaga sp.]|uniref:phage terminase large subunit n=1 Tax=Hydrogenophaga sp. TaxID=1904254 RepID=UPI002FC5C12A